MVPAAVEQHSDRQPRRVRTIVVVGTAVSLVLAGIVSFFANGNPDGLEYVAADQGFLATARNISWVTSRSPTMAASAVCRSG